MPKFKCLPLPKGWRVISDEELNSNEYKESAKRGEEEMVRFRESALGKTILERIRIRGYL